MRFRRHTLARASAGARIFVIGLAQKVLIADQVAILADVIFDATRHPSLFEAWIGTLSYTVQIYYDFAGYSNMAIGIGVMFGFTLPRNFRLPYRSQSITEFWRRWHISLSSWLRDYVYIPLGGNRYGALRIYRNLISVFLLCGLWHGASWNFVVWGLWHGIFLVLERLGVMGWTKHTGVFGRRIYTLLVVMGGWIVFRANDLGAARRVIEGAFGKNGVGPIGFNLHGVLSPIALTALSVGFMLCLLPASVSLLRPGVRFAAVFDRAWTLALLLAAVLFVASGTFSPFLYFRF